MEEPIVKDFMATDEFRYYVEDGEVILMSNIKCGMTATVWCSLPALSVSQLIGHVFT